MMNSFNDHDYGFGDALNVTRHVYNRAGVLWILKVQGFDTVVFAEHGATLLYKDILGNTGWRLENNGLLKVVYTLILDDESHTDGDKWIITDKNGAPVEYVWTMDKTDPRYDPYIEHDGVTEAMNLNHPIDIWGPSF